MTERQPKRHKQGVWGLQDTSLEVVIEGTDLANQRFRQRIDAIKDADEAFTKAEIDRARSNLEEAKIVIRHYPTPLPIPKQ